MTNEFEYHNQLYGQPIWQVFPYPGFPKYFPQEYVDKCAADTKGSCPFCGRQYGEVTEIKVMEGLNVGHYVAYTPDDYITVTGISRDGSSASVSMIRKPKCWGEYPSGHSECTGDCRVQRECRKETFPYGKSDDNNCPADGDLPEDEPEEMPERIDDTAAHPGECDHADTTETCDDCGLVVKRSHTPGPTVMDHLRSSLEKAMSEEIGVEVKFVVETPEAKFWRRWEDVMRSNGFSAEDIAGAGSYTHDELDQIASILEGEQNGKDDYDETQEPWYKESLDKGRARHNHSS